VYFVLHASTDWLLRIPAIAIPGFVVLGALATGGSEGELILAARTQRVALAAAALLAVGLAAPAYLSTSAVATAESEAATSSGAALGELTRAARLNPFAAEPLVVRSTVLQLEGKRTAALAAARTGTHRAPNDWTTWIVLARARRATGDLSGSRSALRRAAMLNPRVTRSEPAAR
jgi:cytochrome c-type biogenesis protein CcmH/NrfG